ncbi:MAG TPA: hypothetical protein VIJ83_05460 [Solirubrobacteraceae bacterium]
MELLRNGLAKLSREDRVLAAAAIALVIGLLVFPWYSVTVAGVGVSGPATSAPDGFWAVLALLIILAVVADLALVRFSPATAIPTTKFGRDRTRVVGVALAALCLLIKLLAQTSFLAWGFWVNTILLIVVAVAAWGITGRR